MKHIKLLLLINVFFQLNFCYAQKDSVTDKKFDRFYISLTGGVGIPVGAFAKYDIQDTSYNLHKYLWQFYHILAGEPRTGITVKLSSGYSFSSYFGLAAMAFAGSFKGKNKDALQTVGPASISYPQSIDAYSYNVKSWITNGYMLGFFVNKSFNKIDISAKLLGGIQRTVLPQTNTVFLLTDFYGPVQYDSIIQPSVSSNSFGWDAGIDARIKTGKKINILLSADFISSKATFSDSLYANIRNYSYGIYHGTFDKHLPFKYSSQIEYLSLTAGIAYIFK